MKVRTPSYSPRRIPRQATTSDGLVSFGLNICQITALLAAFVVGSSCVPPTRSSVTRAACGAYVTPDARPLGLFLSRNPLPHFEHCSVHVAPPKRKAVRVTERFAVTYPGYGPTFYMGLLNPLTWDFSAMRLTAHYSEVLVYLSYNPFHASRQRRTNLRGCVVSRAV